MHLGSATAPLISQWEQVKHLPTSHTLAFIGSPALMSQPVMLSSRAKEKMLIPLSEARRLNSVEMYLCQDAHQMSDLKEFQ